MSVDLTTLAGVMAATMALVSVLRAKIPLVQQYTEYSTALIALALTAISKASGMGFAEMEWIPALIGAVFAALGSNVAYDKLVKNTTGGGGGTGAAASVILLLPLLSGCSITDEWEEIQRAGSKTRLAHAAFDADYESAIDAYSAELETLQLQFLDSVLQYEISLASTTFRLTEYIAAVPEAERAALEGRAAVVTTERVRELVAQQSERRSQLLVAIAAKREEWLAAPNRDNLRRLIAALTLFTDQIADAAAQARYLRDQVETVTLQETP